MACQHIRDPVFLVHTYLAAWYVARLSVETIVPVKQVRHPQLIWDYDLQRLQITWSLHSIPTKGSYCKKSQKAILMH